jgi:hypothetical protein
MERFQQAHLEDGEEIIEFWFRVSAGKLPYGGALARMGLEMSSIPAMSTEAERVFSK